MASIRAPCLLHPRSFPRFLGSIALSWLLASSSRVAVAEGLEPHPADAERGPRDRGREAEEVDRLRAALIAGDLITIAHGRARLADRGSDVTIGALGLLDDLSRLVRCLSIGTIPEHEASDVRVLRTLVRLDRVRLDRLEHDGVHRESALVHLLGEPPLYVSVPPRDAAPLVRWPIEEERWPDELVEGLLDRGRCAERPGARAEPVSTARAESALARAERERELTASLVAELDTLPPEAGARIAYAYVINAANTEGFRIPLDWAERLARALTRSAPFGGPGLIALARLHQAGQEEARARAIYRALLDGETPVSDEEDSRIRVQLTALEEPDYARVLAVVQGARAVRPVDEPALAYAKARALYGLNQIEALMTFGRRWLQGERGNSPIEAGTRDLLVRLAVQRPAAEALAWVTELGDPGSLDARLDQLGQLALESGRFDLAAGIYDRLRAQAASAPRARGGKSGADEARWIAQRARVEFAREDVETFAGLVDALVLLAAREQDRPLGRNAPHREIVRLTRDVMGRLTNEVASHPEQRKLAALLYEATTRLLQRTSRYTRDLEEQATTLLALAGRYAQPQNGRATGEARRAASGRGAPRPIRHLGEVVIPRLPPRLDLPDYPTPSLEVDTFIVFEKPGGERTTGAPWTTLVEKRAAEKLKPR